MYTTLRFQVSQTKQLVLPQGLLFNNDPKPEMEREGRGGGDEKKDRNFHYFSFLGNDLQAPEWRALIFMHVFSMMLCLNTRHPRLAFL